MKLVNMDDMSVEDLQKVKRNLEYQRDHFNRELHSTNMLMERALVKEMAIAIMAEQDENGIQDELYFRIMLNEFAMKLRNIKE